MKLRQICDFTVAFSNDNTADAEPFAGVNSNANVNSNASCSNSGSGSSSSSSNANHTIDTGSMISPTIHHSIVTYILKLSRSLPRHYLNLYPCLTPGGLACYDPADDSEADVALRLLNDSAKLRVLDGLLTSIRQLQPAEKVVVVSNFTTSLDAVEAIARYRRHTRFVYCVSCVV